MSSKKLENLKMELTDLIKQMSVSEAMLPGDCREVYRKCGKINCWCHTAEKGHPLKRITWLDNGSVRTKTIPEHDFNRIKEITDNYGQFRKKRGKLFKLVKSFADELNKL